MKQPNTLTSSAAFSIIAAILLFFIIWTASPDNSSLDFPEKAGIVSVFLVCCGAGIYFTFKPRLWRNLFSSPKDKLHQHQSVTKRSFQGHHPDCPTFHNHTIRLQQKIRCAGCLGLFIGFSLSIFIMIFYTILNISVSKMIVLSLFFVGLGCITVVFLEIGHQRRRAVIHVGINSLMPIGFLLIIIAVNEGTRDLLYGFFSLLFCFLWMDTRILFSKAQHRILCRNCGESCKMFTDPIYVSKAPVVQK